MNVIIITNERMNNNETVNKDYLVLIWMMTIALVPLVWIAYQILFSGGNWRSMFLVLPLFYIYGLFYSAPTFFILLICFYLLSKNEVSSIWSKIILSVIGISGILITFHLIGGSLSRELALFYSIGYVITIFVVNFKMRLKFL